jgi:RNA polymerase sigma-70 factor (ECF subfamily)
MFPNEPKGTADIAASEFTTTQWALVLAARDPNDQVSEQALNELCTRYWFPLYAFARRQGCNPETAQDAVQGFFARLLARRDLESVRRERGRFRTFCRAPGYSPA